MAELWDTAAFGTGSPAEMSGQPDGMSTLVGGLYNYFGGLAKRAIGNSQTAVDTGTYNAAPVLEAAMLPMGTGAIAGVPIRTAETALRAAPPIRAYHGSPHNFNRFDLSRVGSGEGAQTYGHGLYFAENPLVAEGYADKLARRASSATDTVASPDLAPRRYEVNIQADPSKMLAWDKPYHEQPALVQDVWAKLAPLLPVEEHGAALYQKLASDARLERYVSTPIEDKKYASDQLKKFGVPGIKYLDQGSRGAGQGSSNYVVFNDKLIDIMRKYGIALPGGAAAADAYTRSQEPAI